VLVGERENHNPLFPGMLQSTASWTFMGKKLELISTPIDGGKSLVGEFLAKRPTLDAAFHHITN
jgi:hypothetical protein